jgi:dual specificity phosphatase 12
MRRLECADPCRALVVEDAVNGLKAARAAGAFVVAVTTSLPQKDLQPWSDLVLHDLRDLVPLLATLVPDNCC